MDYPIKIAEAFGCAIVMTDMIRTAVTMAHVPAVPARARHIARNFA